MIMKVSVPNRLQFKAVSSFTTMLWQKKGEVHYIGGADILPPPLESKREAEMISRLGTEGEKEARALLIEHNLRLPEDTVTDQPMRQIAAELIREKALRMLDEEIPHGIAVTIEKMSERPNGIMDVEATIICERDSHKGIIIGKGGAMLKRIGSAARRELEDMLETKVNLQIWVKVRREWRDSELLMKNYGYNPKE